MESGIRRAKFHRRPRALRFAVSILCVTALTGWGACGKPVNPAGESLTPISHGDEISHVDEASAVEAEVEPPPARTAVLPEEVDRLLSRLESEPLSPDAYFARGQILDMYGQTDEAVWCWRACLRLDARHARALERIALVLVRRGEFEEAARRFRESGELAPELPEIRLHLGKVLLQLGRADEAVSILERQAALHPRSAEAWFRLGQAYLETEQLEKSRHCFQTALDILPDCLPAWFGMSQVCERLGEVEKARECRARLLELDEQQAATERARRKTGELRQLDDDRTLSQSLTIGADSLALHGQAADAESFWRRAAKLDAQNAICRQSLAHHLARRNRPAEAIPVLEELHNLQPRKIDPLLALAAIHQQTQQPEPAERALQQALEIAPNDPRACAGMARFHLSTGRQLPEAQRLAERLISIQPTAENFFLLASLCQANRDRGGAKAALQEAVRLDPQNARYAAAAGQLSEE